jgi:pyruvate carboxylase subunit B
MNYIATVDNESFRISLDSEGRVILNGEPVKVDLTTIDGGFHYSLLMGSVSYEVFVERCDDVCLVTLEGLRYRVRIEDERSQRLEQHRPRVEPDGEAKVVSPMPGVVVAVLVEVGQEVRAGEGLLILEAMKMENEIRAGRTGVIESVHVAPGQRVSQNDALVQIG